MKKHEWLDRLGGIDPKYIEEATPTAQKAATAVPPPQKRPARPWRRLWPAAMAACLCVAMMISAAVWLIPDREAPSGNRIINKPFPGMMADAKDYNHVFDQLDAYRENHIFTEEADEDDALVGDAVVPEDAAPGATLDGSIETTPSKEEAPTPDETEASDDAYQEITDNQVAGVIEGDRIKRTKTHIFYLRQNSSSQSAPVLEIYTIAKEDSKKVGSYEMSVEYVNAKEFYLSSDGRTVTVIAVHNSRTHVLSLDVSKPESIEEKGEVAVDGAIKTSRLTGGTFLLITQYRAGYYNKDTERDAETYIPKVNSGEGDELIAPADIWVDGTPCSDVFTILVMMDPETLEIKSQKAFLAFSGEPYVNTDAIYLTRQFYADKETHTGILGVVYNGEGFGYLGECEVEGYILNQYSMDAYNGVFRLVTTVLCNGEVNASLYCIDLETWQTVASVENFAPAGEDVRSVRFDGDKAYVCTAIRQTDPVFYFDLSNLDNITVKDTGDIAGFSTSLIQLGNGYLMGVGSDSLGMKLEVYRETADAVESVAVYRADDMDYSSAASEYKSYYIDRAQGLFGLSYRAFNYRGSSVSFYVLLQFDQESETLRTLVKQEILSSFEEYGRYINLNNTRGVVIDGYLYLFAGYSEFYVIKL